MIWRILDRKRLTALNWTIELDSDIDEMEAKSFTWAISQIYIYKNGTFATMGIYKTITVNVYQRRPTGRISVTSMERRQKVGCFQQQLGGREEDACGPLIIISSIMMILCNTDRQEERLASVNKGEEEALFMQSNCLIVLTI